MKLAIAAFLLTLTAWGQTSSVAGNWQGTLEAGPLKLRIGLHITPVTGGFKATVDSVDQASLGIPAEIELLGTQVRLEVPSQQTIFVGEWAGNQIEGVMFQDGEMPLTFRRVAKVDVLNRPQEPHAPLSYLSEQVHVSSGSVKLAGTLARPLGAGPFPAVILLGGAAPQDRDASFAGHKPLLVIADALARKGIASLRLDDRGMGQSEGVAADATLGEQSKDVSAAIAFLKTRPGIDAKKIGVIGHREGAVIAASNREAAFLVLLSPPGVPGDELLYRQGELIARSAGASQQSIDDARDLQRRMIAILREEPDEFRAIEKIREAWSEGRELLPGPMRAQVDQQIVAAASPAMRSFLLADPGAILKNVRSPALVIFGEKDVQTSPAQNLPAVTAALIAAGNPDFSVMLLPGLNHQLQNCHTCAVTEYATLEETISPVALDAITSWIQKRYTTLHSR